MRDRTDTPAGRLCPAKELKKMKTINVVVRGIKTKAIEKDTYVIAEWFAAKVFKEKRGTNFFDNRIFAIIGETEKAYNVILGTAIKHLTTWCPKSLVRVDEEQNENDITFVCDYNKAMEIAEAIQECFE